MKKLAESAAHALHKLGLDAVEIETERLVRAPAARSLRPARAEDAER